MKKTVNELMREPTLPTLEIGGIGPQYEDACQTMLYRFVKWMEDKNPDDLVQESRLKPEVERELMKLVDDIGPSGAMWGVALSHAFYIRRNGYAKWLETGNKGRVIMWRPHLD